MAVTKQGSSFWAVQTGCADLLLTFATFSPWYVQNTGLCLGITQETEP